MRNFVFYLTRKIILYRTILNDQGIIINKKKQNHTVEYISIDQKNIKTSSLVKRLGVHTDDQLILMYISQKFADPQQTNFTL